MNIRPYHLLRMLCRFGYHAWHRYRVPGGQKAQVCFCCGKLELRGRTFRPGVVR